MFVSVFGEGIYLHILYLHMCMLDHIFIMLQNVVSTIYTTHQI